MERATLKTIEYLCQELNDYIIMNSENSDDMDDMDDNDDSEIPHPIPLPKKGCCHQVNNNKCNNYNNNKCNNYNNNKYNNNKCNNIKEWWEGTTLEKEILDIGYSDKHPCYGDKVVIDYEMKLLDGTGVDWSRKPYKFMVGDSSIMEGLSKGVVKMRLGEKAKLYIPFDMAYGWKSPMSIIPEASDLVVTCRLIKIMKNKCSNQCGCPYYETF